MKGFIFKSPSILKKFLLINLVIFVIIGLFTIFYLKSIQILVPGSTVSVRVCQVTTGVGGDHLFSFQVPKFWGKCFHIASW